MNQYGEKMKNKNLFYFVLFALVIGLFSYGFSPDEKDKTKRQSKVTTNDNANYIDINQIFMWVANNGMGSHDPRTDASGFYWPGGPEATIAAIFSDGLIWGAKVGREIRVNGGTYRYGLQAGKILPDGTADDPSNPRYRIYKIRKGWESLPAGPTRDAYEKDYNEWPMEDGAPYEDVDGNGAYTPGVDVPKFEGDMVLWCVSNDLDASRSTYTYGTLPMGLEQQMTVFGFNRTGDLGDMVFKKYTIINKGDLTLKDMYFGYWSDTDLGDANDDYTGADTVLSLGYTYNGDNNDALYYGPNPPAVGYDFFQGPIVPALPTDSAKFLGKWKKGYRNLPMTAFTFFINSNATYSDPDLGVAAGSVQFYNYLTGYVWDGSPFVDPNTGNEVKFVLSGDPVNRTGWYEGPGWPGGPVPGDRRHTMCSGPFTMAPGDTQEVVVGIVIARGSSNINSVTELKRKDLAAQVAYDLDFNLTPAPEAPQISAFADDGEVTLYWEPNSENYDEVDPLIFNQGLEDTTYTFQGYRVWQFSDIAGADPTLLYTSDVKDDVDLITQSTTIDTFTVNLPVFELPNQGVTHFFRTREDKINGVPLVNARPYYFAVTAFGYSPNSDPQYLENPPQIIEVRPGRQAIDVALTGPSGEEKVAEQVNGSGDGDIKFWLVDPLALTGDEYEIAIAEDTTYSIINVTNSDTAYTGLTSFGSDSLFDKYVVDGFVVSVQNTGFEKIKELPGNQLYRSKNTEEYAGPNGAVLNPPVIVDTSLNSTGKWQIVVGGNGKLNWDPTVKNQSLGYDNYEIRFAGTSNYYVSGHQPSLFPAYGNDSLAVDTDGNLRTLPFTVWNVGRDYIDPSDDYQLVIKVLDIDRQNPDRAIWDNQWTKLPNGKFEELYAFDIRPFGFRPDSLPTRSGSSRPTALIPAVHKWGQLVIDGELPEPGTIIRINTWRGLSGFQGGDKFRLIIPASAVADANVGKEKVDQITVFPNPYFGAQGIEANKYERFMRFTGMPAEATIRIVSLAGVFIRKLEKDATTQYVDWNLQNSDGLPVASGVYIAYIDMPGIGTKIMKLAVIQETQYIDRI
jgi:hypothetical protein